MVTKPRCCLVVIESLCLIAQFLKETARLYKAFTNPGFSSTALLKLLITPQHDLSALLGQDHDYNRRQALLGQD